MISAGEIREFRKNWPMLIAAVFGGAMIAAPFYAIGHFMEPWEAEFGWSRTDIAVALSLHVLCLAVAAPMVGVIVTRFGVRRTVLISMTLMGFGFMLESQITSQIWTLYASFALVAIVGAGTTIVSFSRAVTGVFDHGRGLALGIIASASVVSGFAVPILVHNIMGEYGWRTTIFAFGALTLAMVPIVALGLRPRKQVREQIVEDVSAPTNLEGKTLGQAVRGWRFWVIGCSFLLMTFATTGAFGQIFPILREKGLLSQEAILIQSSMAFGLGTGRILAGFLVDRVFASTVYLLICVFAAVGLAALAWGPVGAVWIACIALSFALGAEFDILAYMVSRYFGLKEYARIFGWLYGVAFLGSVLSPVALSSIRDAGGRYEPALAVAAVISLLAGLLVVKLGPYYAGRKQQVEPA